MFTKLINWYINNLYLYIYIIHTYLAYIRNIHNIFFMNEVFFSTFWKIFFLKKETFWNSFDFFKIKKIIANIFKLKPKKKNESKNYWNLLKQLPKFFNNHIKTYIFMLLWLCFWVLVFFFSSHFPCFYFLLIWQFFFFFTFCWYSLINSFSYKNLILWENLTLFLSSRWVEVPIILSS